MTFSQTWLPFIYLYGVGGIAFLLGTLLIYKTKALRINYESHKKWFWVLFYGYFFYASVHALFIYLAIGSSY
tara:strand:+ start:23528 stop:23743 length:216 start_codon:yes stop_codon:yes gene_type:complete